MAFRDETEALRHQRKIVQEEIESLEGEKATIDAALASQAQDVEREVRLRVGGAVTGAALIAILVPIIGVTAMTCIGGGEDAEMLFGRISATSGSAPFPVDTPCTLFVHYVSGNKNKSWNGQLEIICDGRTLYGGDGSGYLDCTWNDDIATSCVDGDYTADGGDPKLTFDRSAWRALVEEARPAWQVQIELTPVEGH